MQGLEVRKENQQETHGPLRGSPAGRGVRGEKKGKRLCNDSAGLEAVEVAQQKEEEGKKGEVINAN